MIYAWGQFLDHDLDLTPGIFSEEDPGGVLSGQFNIPVPAGDPSVRPATFQETRRMVRVSRTTPGL